MAGPCGPCLLFTKHMQYSILLGFVLTAFAGAASANSNTLSASQGLGLQTVEVVRAFGGNSHNAMRHLAKEVRTAAAKQPGKENPLLTYYRKETQQYEKDAVEAAKAAEMYTKMAEQAVPIAAKDATSLTKQELSRIDVDTWAHATWQFEQMLHNPLPGKAAAAAAAPIGKTVGDYAKAEAAYDVTAQEYANRVALDTDLSKKLITYAHQYALQGNQEMSDAYKEQATLLMNQATKFADISKGYNKMATKIFNVIPILQGMAGTTGNFAAWKVDPGGSLPAEHVFPFTPVPPLEFVQTADKATTAKSQSSFLSR